VEGVKKIRVKFWPLKVHYVFNLNAQLGNSNLRGKTL